MASKAFLRKQKDGHGNDVLIFMMISHELVDLGDESVVAYDVVKSENGTIVMYETARDESGINRYGEPFAGMRADQILTSL